MDDTERVTRGSLPHWYKPGHAHFVTYRLADSIPHVRLKQWREERQHRFGLPIPTGLTIGQHRERAHKLFFEKYDDCLDRHPNVHWLENNAVAEAVRENLYHHHGSLYELIAWCLMPNHAHILIQPSEKGLRSTTSVATDAGRVSHVADAASIGNYRFSDELTDRASVLSRIMHSLKSYTANRANEILGHEGRFWQRESYDHWVRDIDEIERIVDYICVNPVTAGLCKQPHEWRFSSAFDRYMRDGSTCGTVGWLKDDWRR